MGRSSLKRAHGGSKTFRTQLTQRMPHLQKKQLQKHAKTILLSLQWGHVAMLHWHSDQELFPTGTGCLRLALSDFWLLSSIGHPIGRRFHSDVHPSEDMPTHPRTNKVHQPFSRAPPKRGWFSSTPISPLRSLPATKPALVVGWALVVPSLGFFSWGFRAGSCQPASSTSARCTS